MGDRVCRGGIQVGDGRHCIQGNCLELGDGVAPKNSYISPHVAVVSRFFGADGILAGRKVGKVEAAIHGGL
ncbi:hypothetical protein D3C87_1936190 [compost metagenome]